MRRFILIGLVGLIGAVCFAATVKRTVHPPRAADDGATAQPTGKLVVHEWGTFTGFAGSDGVYLPFNTIVGSDLPEFVMNRLTHAARLDPRLNGLFFVKAGGAAALQRMETPVIYFYTDAPREVEVRVDFPQGFLTEFYPPVREMGPTYGNALGEHAHVAPAPVEASQTSAQTQPAKAVQPAASFLDWGRVRIVPNPTADEAKTIPAVANESHYRFARDTDSALVQFTDADGITHGEKFLFYRGLGNFSLPVTLAATGSDHFQIRNAGRSPIPVAFLIQIDSSDRNSARFVRIENVTGDERLTLPAAKAPTSNLADAIRKSLIAGGLFAKEAGAMVETWKSSWLDEPGTRLLYVVPRAVTDSLLPLHVTPSPDETIRVLVGRIDVLTPELESRLRSMIPVKAKEDLSTEDARILEDLGRFRHPALERVRGLAGITDQQPAGLPATPSIENPK